MRRAPFILLLLLIISPFTLSQSLNYGFKGSINASSLYGGYIFTSDDLVVDLDPNVSSRFSAGGFIRYNLSRVTSIQTEFFYSTRGARINEDIQFRNQTLNLDGDITLAYIEVPVLIRLNTLLPDRGPTFVREPGFTFNAFLGGSFAYKTNATLTGRLTGEVLGDYFNERFKNTVWNQFVDTDFSFIVGAGFEYGVNYRFTFDIRYVVTILDIGNDPNIMHSIRNGAVSIFIGTVFFK
jgi:hypothetical protein